MAIFHCYVSSPEGTICYHIHPYSIRKKNAGETLSRTKVGDLKWRFNWVYIITKKHDFTNKETVFKDEYFDVNHGMLGETNMGITW